MYILKSNTLPSTREEYRPRVQDFPLRSGKIRKKVFFSRCYTPFDAVFDTIEEVNEYIAQVKEILPAVNALHKAIF